MADTWGQAKAVWSLVTSGVGITLATGGFVTFGTTTHYRNLVAASLALLSGVYASIVFLISYLRLRRRVSTWYTEKNFECFRLFAVVGSLLSFALMAFYIFMHIYLKRAILPVETSFIIPAVWAFITFKWSIVLYFMTRNFRSDDGSDQQLIPNTSANP